MRRFRCPECGTEHEVTPRYGDEVVSVYCLRHRDGIDGRARLVYMTCLRPAVVEPELVPA